MTPWQWLIYVQLVCFSPAAKKALATTQENQSLRLMWPLVCKYYDTLLTISDY
jgi:hypothetical protein